MLRLDDIMTQDLVALSPEHTLREALADDRFARISNLASGRTGRNATEKDD